MTLHEGRHSNASYLIEGGLNDLELTATIGHSDPRTTKMIYGHPFPDSVATVASKIDSYLDEDRGLSAGKSAGTTCTQRAVLSGFQRSERPQRAGKRHYEGLILQFESP